ncbi:MAG: PDZ domain-containing protein [Planctomycetes bacterium]|nr:PDZ domain-containing protein [Planctomycetota bacterium]
MAVGARVQVKVKRAGEVRPLEIVTEELTTARSQEQDFARWGLVGQNITERLAQRENLSSTRGVYVTGVRRGEPAEKAGVQKGDVVFQAGDLDVAGLKDLSKCYDDGVRQKQAMVLVKVRRGMAVVPLVLRVDFDAGKKPPPKAPATKPSAPAAKPSAKPPQEPPEKPADKPPEKPPDRPPEKPADMPAGSAQPAEPKP